MLLFFGVTLVIIFGYLLSTLLVKEMHILERLGTSFLLGFGIFTLLMFCYSSLGVKITLQGTLTALVIGISFLFATSKLLKRKMSINLLGFIKSFSTFFPLEKIIVFIITGLITASLILSIYYPVYIWDALALYDFRAKVITQLGFYTQIANNFSYFDGYPLFTSLSHTLVYIFKGNNPQFLYSFMYTSFIFVFYNCMREFVNRKISLVMALLLASTTDIFSHSTFAYTNLPYTIFLAIGSLYLFIWLTKKKTIGYLILAGMFTGLSTWTRVAEPFWVINIFILFFFSVYKFKKYIFPTIIYIGSFLFIKQPWSMISYYQSAGVAITTEIGSYTTKIFGTMFNIERVVEVVVFIYQNVIVTWFPFLFLFLFCILLNFKDFFKKKSTFFLTIFFLHFILLLYGSYRFSFDFAEWINIADSARRMAMFFIPLMIFYIGLSLEDVNYKHK